MGLPPIWYTTYIILLYQCYTRSKRSIALPATIRRHLLHMDYPLDLLCHPLQFVCSSFEVEGEGELIGEVVIKIVREVVVHLSRHCLLPYPPPPPPPPPYLPITRYFHTSPYLPITRYFYTPIDLHITFHTPTHLHIFTISGVSRASFHGSKYDIIILPISYIVSHR